jgi:hypothetical protein
MKKILIPIFAIALLSAACSKNRDCVCTYTDSNGQTVTADTEQIKASKSRAKKACEKKDDEWADVNGSCKLK